MKLEGGIYITSRINKLQIIFCSVEAQADVNITWSMNGGDLSRLASMHNAVKHSTIYNHTSVLKLLMTKEEASQSYPCEYSRQLDKYICNSTLSCQAEYSFNKSIKSVDTKQILFTFGEYHINHITTDFYCTVCSRVIKDIFVEKFKTYFLFINSLCMLQLTIMGSIFEIWTLFARSMRKTVGYIL